MSVITTLTPKLVHYMQVWKFAMQIHMSLDIVWIFGTILIYMAKLAGFLKDFLTVTWHIFLNLLDCYRSIKIKLNVSTCLIITSTNSGGNKLTDLLKYLNRILRFLYYTWTTSFILYLNSTAFQRSMILY